MTSPIEKFSITPLARCAWQLSDALPLDLSNGLSIQNYQGRVPSIAHWDQYLSKNDIETVAHWNVCMEHRYLGQPHLQGEENESSRRFVAAAVACLRFLTPSVANGNHCLQLEKTPSGD